MDTDLRPSGIEGLGIARDITERKEIEEALRRSEANFRTLAEKALQGIAIYQDKKMVYANDALAGITGYTVEELKSMPVEQIVARTHHMDRPVSEARLHKHTAGEALSASVEVRISRKDGSTCWLQSFDNSIEYNGRPALLSTVIDITERKQAEEALRKSEDHLRLVIDTIPIMAWTIQPDGTVDFLNQRWTDYSGLSLEQYVADPTSVIHPEDIPEVLDKWGTDMAAGKPSGDEMRLQGADGEYRWFLIRTAPLHDESGKIIKWYGVATDIDDRKRAEVEVERQAARAETLARIAARLNQQLDLEAVVHAVCEEAITIFNVSQAAMSLYDKKLNLLVYTGGANIPPKYVPMMEPITQSRFDDFLRTMGPIIVIPDIQSAPDIPNSAFNSELGVRTVVASAMLRDRALVGALVMSVNGHVREFTKDELNLLKAISDQAAQAIANALLLKSANEQHEQLRALSTRLVETQEAERRALTTELHDRVGQNLTGLSINLQNIKAMLSDEDAKRVAAKFDDAQALVEHTTRQIRDILAELHPPELEDYGLAVALETYAERAASRGNLELIADLPDLTSQPPFDVSTALFRAAQEAINNVLKHADATQLEATLEERNGKILLRVEDNGRGFDPDAGSPKEALTWGLKIMCERIEAIGGNVRIQSELGVGTRVTFEIRSPS